MIYIIMNCSKIGMKINEYLKNKFGRKKFLHFSPVYLFQEMRKFLFRNVLLVVHRSCFYSKLTINTKSKTKK